MHFIYMYTVYVQWDTFQVSQMYMQMMLYFVLCYCILSEIHSYYMVSFIETKVNRP